MSAPTYEEFIAKYPAFAQVTQSVVEDQLSDSAADLSATAWGAQYGKAVSLDAAHNLALNQMYMTDAGKAVQGAGLITGTSAAGVNISFSQPQWSEKGGSQDWYRRTLYGQEFLRLRSKVIPCGALAS